MSPALHASVLEDARAFVGTYVFHYSRYAETHPQLWRVVDVDVPEDQPTPTRVPQIPHPYMGVRPVCRVWCVDHTGQRVWFWGNTMCYDQSRQAEFALQFAVLEAEAQGAA